jgi:hypothetical protein
MIPMPGRLGEAVTYPVRKLIGKKPPETGKEVLTTMLVYLAFTVSTSLIASYFIT